jgi:hypothetical protein
MQLTLDQATYLGPARVKQVAGALVALEFPDQVVWARTALAAPYEVAVGDVVLAVGQEEAWYVIGLLQGAGVTTLSVPGDLRIRAPHGTIELNAAKGIRLKSPSVQILTAKLAIVAKAVFERFASATRWIKGIFQLRAGRMRTRVKDAYDLAAGRILERADNEVIIDGEKIHLG